MGIFILQKKFAHVINNHYLHPMKKITQWEKVTNSITQKWIKKYFDSEDYVDWWWVSDKIGCIFFVADYYIDFSDVLFCFENNVDKNKFFEWYEWSLETGMEGKSTMDLKDFLISPEKKNKKKDAEYLQELTLLNKHLKKL